MLSKARFMTQLSLESQNVEAGIFLTISFSCPTAYSYLNRLFNRKEIKLKDVVDIVGTIA